MILDIQLPNFQSLQSLALQQARSIHQELITQGIIDSNESPKSIEFWILVIRLPNFQSPKVSL